MQNKIYTLLANLYNDIKGVKSDKSTLEEAIDSKINNQSEILNARGDYEQLDDRLKDIDNKVDYSSTSIESLRNKIDEVRDKPVPIVNPVIQVVDVDTRPLLVSLENRIKYREDEFNMLIGEKKLLQVDNQNTIIELWSNVAATNIATQSIVYKSNLDVAFDQSINTLANTIISPMNKSELYEIPLNTAKLFYNNEMDACIFPGIGVCSADYSNPSIIDNYINCLQNTFDLDENTHWIVDRSFVNVVFSFDIPTSISRLTTSFATNTSLSKIKIEYSSDDITWTQLYYGNTTDYEYNGNITFKYLRFYYNIFDGTPKNTITLKSIKLFTTNYNTESGMVITKKPLVLNGNDTALQITPSTTTVDENYIRIRYGMINTSLSDNPDSCYTYIPKLFDILPIDFYDSVGFKYSNTTLSSGVKINTKHQIRYYTVENYPNPLSSITGQLGTTTVYYDDTNTSSGVSSGGPNFSNSWQPYRKIAYMIKIVAKNGSSYTIPLYYDNINKSIKVTLSGITYYIKVNIIASDALKIFIDSESTTIPEIRVEAHALKQIYEANADNSTTSETLTRYDVKGYPINISGLNHNYYAYYSYQTPYNAWTYYYEPYYSYNWGWHNGVLGWGWEGGWTWGWKTAWQNNYKYSSMNGTDSSTAVAIIPNDLTSGTYKTSRTIESVTNATFFVNNFSLCDCSLPAVVYVGCNGTSTLYNRINEDNLSVGTKNYDPVYSYKQDFINKSFIGNSKIIRITSSQNVSSQEDVEYEISFDGYNYYVYDTETSKWKLSRDKGMSGIQLANIGDTQYKLIQNGAFVFIKVRIISPNASISKISVELDSDSFELIGKEDILTKGMSRQHVEKINAKTLNNLVKMTAPDINFITVAKSMYPIFKYNLSGFSIRNQNNPEWKKAEESTTKQYLLSNNNILLENVSGSAVKIKAIYREIENQTAIVDTTQSLKDHIDVLNDNISTIMGYINNMVKTACVTVDSDGDTTFTLNITITALDRVTVHLNETELKNTSYKITYIDNVPTLTITDSSITTKANDTISVNYF